MSEKLEVVVSETVEGWEVKATTYDGNRCTGEKCILMESPVVADALARFVRRVGVAFGMAVEPGSSEISQSEH